MMTDTMVSDWSLTSKSLAAASEYDAANVRVTLQVIKDLTKFSHQSSTEGIQSLGAVQLYEAHIVLLTFCFHYQVLVLCTW